MESLPTLCTGQADDLKIDTGTVRVWLSRMTKEDGERVDNLVTVEHLRGGYVPATRSDYENGGKRGYWESSHWVTVYTYEAK